MFCRSVSVAALCPSDESPRRCDQSGTGLDLWCPSCRYPSQTSERVAISPQISRPIVVTAEAWVKGTSHPSENLRGVQISSEIVEEPLLSAQFCRKFQQGQCQRLAGECFYQHILCAYPGSCVKFECVYGHYFSIRRSRVHGHPTLYRLKLTDLLSAITKEELKRHLPEIDVSCLKFSPNLGERNVVYLVDQTSANFLRKAMRRFPQFECQLETNESFFDWDRPVEISRPVEKASVPFKPAPWFKPVSFEK